MVLCGIGGKTIAEAQDQLSYEEYIKWLWYRQKFGPLDTFTRQDRGFALIACAISGEKKLTTFMPFHDEGEEGQPVSLGQSNELADQRLASMFGAKVSTERTSAPPKRRRKRQQVDEPRESVVKYVGVDPKIVDHKRLVRK